MQSYRNRQATSYHRPKDGMGETMLAIHRKASSPSTPSIDELREGNQEQCKEGRHQ